MEEGGGREKKLMKVDGKRDGGEEGRKTVSSPQYQGHSDTYDRKGSS